MLEDRPLKFPPDRLGPMIERIQEISETIPAGSRPFTLDMLRARLDADRQL
jgi:hypothetical protein